MMLSFSNLMLNSDLTQMDEMRCYSTSYIYYSYVSGLELATPMDSFIIIKLYTLNITQQYNVQCRQQLGWVAMLYLS